MMTETRMLGNENDLPIYMPALSVRFIGPNVDVS